MLTVFGGGLAGGLAGVLVFGLWHPGPEAQLLGQLLGLGLGQLWLFARMLAGSFGRRTVRR